ncbi:MAG: hypothetical protein RQ758_06135, partial [Methanomicrobiaceae archaeon]|nr:hypothetical protein [Methanomicrobiaceae archaeon]
DELENGYQFYMSAGYDENGAKRFVHKIRLNGEFAVMLPFEKKSLYETLKPEMFEPAVYITGLGGSRMEVAIRLWIHKIQKKDEIVSEFLRELQDAMQTKGLSMETVK